MYSSNYEETVVGRVALGLSLEVSSLKFLGVFMKDDYEGFSPKEWSVGVGVTSLDSWEDY